MLKKILFVIAAVLVSHSVYSQGFTSSRSDSALSKAESMLGARTASYGLQVNFKDYNLEKKREFGAPRTLYYNKLYFLGEVSDSIGIFSHTRGIYMGEYQQEKNKPTFIRHGFGIDRIMDDSSIDDVVRYEFYIGYYKKNRRHGEGYLVRTSGKMIAGKWKRGRLKAVGRRDLSNEEKEKVGDFMRQLRNMM